jgi:peptidase E
MTKLILHGGMTNIPNIHNKKFYQEMLRAAKGRPILACYYSRPYKEWKYLLKSDIERMKKSVGRKKFEIIVASKNVDKFLKQLSEAEAVYFRGGITLKLINKLEGAKRELKKEFSGKVVFGSSAGALFLAKYYYDQDHDKIFNGFNFLPVKIITHYLCSGQYAATSGEDKFKMLDEYKEKLPVYAIPETEFRVVEA